jgi:hypothetical protein
MGKYGVFCVIFKSDDRLIGSSLSTQSLFGISSYCITSILLPEIHKLPSLIFNIDFKRES